jgi:hypothetical protein
MNFHYIVNIDGVKHNFFYPGIPWDERVYEILDVLEFQFKIEFPTEVKEIKKSTSVGVIHGVIHEYFKKQERLWKLECL